MMMPFILGFAVSCAPSAAPAARAESVVRELYPMVSFPANAAPDWAKVRAVFHPDAVITMRTSRTVMSVFSVDGFIDDFVKFAAKPAVRAAGFRERVVRARAMEYGDMAHVLVLYEAEVLGATKPPQRGVDSFHLVRQGGGWKIVSISNEIVTAERPIPSELGGAADRRD